MVDFLKDIFKRGSGTSSMRVMSMISLLTGCYIGIAGLHQDKNLSEVAILCGTFLASAFGAKYAQKTIENKTEV